MALITLPYSNEAQLRAAWASIPTDVIASGNTYVLQQTAVRVNLDQWFIMNNKNTGPSNKIILQAAPGASYSDNASVSNNPFPGDYNDGRASITMTAEAFRKFMILVEIPYTEIRGLDIRQLGTTNENALKFSDVANDGWVDRCIIDSVGSGSYFSPLLIDGQNVRVTSTLIVHRSSVWYAVGLGTKTSVLENVQVVRPSNFTKGNFAFSVASDGNKFVNCSAFGFDEFVNQPNAFPSVGSNNACSGTINFGTNNKQNLNAADQLVNTLSDFRTKAGSALIDAGIPPSSYNTLAPNGVRQQGTSADIGAWEFPNALVAPSATVTAISVTGRNVTISGTTTGVPTSGIATVSPSATPYNSAVTSSPVTVTLGSGTFTVTFSNLNVGEYNLQYQVTNAGYTTNGQNSLGSFSIVGALAATVVQDPMGGQVLRIHGTTTGSPTSGSLIVPADTNNPNGAFDQTKSVTISGNTYDVSITLPVGNYAASILRFTTAAGTSLPQAGTSAVSVSSIDGNPDAPDVGGTPVPAPVVTSVTISPKTATGSVKFSAIAAGTDSPPQTFTYTATGGTVDSQGNYTAPASAGTYAVTATSTYDTSKSDTATVTIQAAQQGRSVEISLTTDGTTPAANLSNLKWAWFDQSSPNLFAAPTDKGVAETTDGTGVLAISLPSTTLAAGAIGWLIVTNSNGSPSSSHNAFSGPVVVI